MKTKIDYDMNDTIGTHKSFHIDAQLQNTPCNYSSMLIMRILHGSSHLHSRLEMDMMGCPDLLITIGAAVRDSYVVLKDSRSVLLVSHRAWQSVENQAASSSRSPKQIARPSEARDISTRWEGLSATSSEEAP
jgi:hypothetical protein